MHQLTCNAGSGSQTAIGIGGDPDYRNDAHIDALRLLNDDPETEDHHHDWRKSVESAGEAAAEFVKQHVKKPVVGFIAGQTAAPPGRRMGHASGRDHFGRAGNGRPDKMKAMTAAGIHVVVYSPLAEIGATLARR